MVGVVGLIGVTGSECATYQAKTAGDGQCVVLLMSMEGRRRALVPELRWVVARADNGEEGC